MEEEGGPGGEGVVRCPLFLRSSPRSLTVPPSPGLTSSKHAAYSPVLHSKINAPCPAWRTRSLDETPLPSHPADHPAIIDPACLHSTSAEMRALPCRRRRLSLHALARLLLPLLLLQCTSPGIAASPSLQCTSPGVAASLPPMRSRSLPLLGLRSP